jgi:hypothetical protein
MAKPKKRRRIPDRNGTQEQRYDFIKHCERLIAERIRNGVYSANPALEAAVADFDPAVALIELAADPANTAETRAACAAKLLPYWHKEQSLLVKEAGGGNAPVSIQVIVAPWAAAKPVLPALSAPKAKDVEVIFKKD